MRLGSELMPRATVQPDASELGARRHTDAPIVAGNSTHATAAATLPDVSRCSSCHRAATHGTALVVLESPRGPYALCGRCLGRDAEPKRTAPNVLAERRGEQGGARHGGLDYDRLSAWAEQRGRGGSP